MLLFAFWETNVVGDNKWREFGNKKRENNF